MKAYRLVALAKILRGLAEELERKPPRGYKYRRLEDEYSDVVHCDRDA